MAKRTTFEDPVFTIKHQRGLADRHRLPLGHVLSVLSEVRQMFTAAGKELQRFHGHKNPDGDFGLELIAGKSGMVFRKGSMTTNMAITIDKANGIRAAHLVLDTVEGLSKGKLIPGPRNGTATQVVRRLNNIAKIHKTDKIVTQFSLKTPNNSYVKKAVFDESAVAYANTITEEEFIEESITVFGKLIELQDRDFEDEGGKGIFGELRHDTGEAWRIQFPESFDKSSISGAFGQQVALTGTVSYYRVARPKLVAEHLDIDPDRDYEVEFDELFGCDRELYGSADLETLLQEIRG